jgi:hypothetical protein
MRWGVSEGLPLEAALRAASLRRYVVKVGPWLYVGRDALVPSEREAREFGSVGQAHAAMKDHPPARGGYSVVPVSH